jgi:hypothetical protein
MGGGKVLREPDPPLLAPSHSLAVEASCKKVKTRVVPDERMGNLHQVREFRVKNDKIRISTKVLDIIDGHYHIPVGQYQQIKGHLCIPATDRIPNAKDSAGTATSRVSLWNKLRSSSQILAKPHNFMDFLAIVILFSLWAGFRDPALKPFACRHPLFAKVTWAFGPAYTSYAFGVFLSRLSCHPNSKTNYAIQRVIFAVGGLLLVVGFQFDGPVTCQTVVLEIHG